MMIHQMQPTDGDVWGIMSDMHYPNHDPAAVNIVIEVMEYAGVTLPIINGDGLDVACLSTHEKDPDAARRFRDEVQSIDPLLRWLNTRGESLFLLGNHERRWHRFLYTRAPELFGERFPLPTWYNGTVLDGGLSEFPKIRAGNLVVEHGDSFWPRGNITPSNPALVILGKAPDQTTIVGHVHKLSFFCRNSYDSTGIRRTHAAHSAGHLSLIGGHARYMGDYPNWNQSFILVFFNRLDGQIRFNITPVEIHRDKRNKPFALYGGKIFK